MDRMLAEAGGLAPQVDLYRLPLGMVGISVQVRQPRVLEVVGVGGAFDNSGRSAA